MHNSPHLVVSISGHGFGHVAQTAPILNVLHQLSPQLRITVRSTVSAAHLRSRIHVPFTHLTSEGDIGMIMTSALDVCVADSRTAYQKFHADWDTRVKDEACILRELKADYVLSNVGYLPLAGAQLAGIPNAALCSLNWADIYRHYCGEDTISSQIHHCYANADAFLRATPGMSMANLPNLIPVEPIATVGTQQRDKIARLLKLSPEEKLVLVSMGGIASRLPIEDWPSIEGVRWLVQESWQIHHPDAVDLESIPMSFSEILSSSDVLVSKPGYGSYVEATCSGIPVLYVNRPDWPEAPALNQWLQQHNVCNEVSRATLEQGNIATTLHTLCKRREIEPLVPEGIVQVTQWLRCVMKLN